MHDVFAAVETSVDGIEEEQQKRTSRGVLKVGPLSNALFSQQACLPFITFSSHCAGNRPCKSSLIVRVYRASDVAGERVPRDSWKSHGE